MLIERPATGAQSSPRPAFVILINQSAMNTTSERSVASASVAAPPWGALDLDPARRDTAPRIAPIRSTAPPLAARERPHVVCRSCRWTALRNSGLAVWCPNCGEPAVCKREGAW